MRAAVLNEQPGRLEIEDIRIDKPGPGEVLLRAVGAGLCHSDLHFMEGTFRSKLPAVLGHESAGIVEAVGEDVSYVQAGRPRHRLPLDLLRPVPPVPLRPPNRCSNPAATSRARDAAPRLTRRTAPRSSSSPGSAASPSRCSSTRTALVKITEDMPLDRAALIGCGITTGMGAVFRTAAVEPGSRVCVIGAGGIGLSAIQAARIAGAGQVIVVDV